MKKTFMVRIIKGHKVCLKKFKFKKRALTFIRTYNKAHKKFSAELLELCNNRLVRS